MKKRLKREAIEMKGGEKKMKGLRFSVGIGAVIALALCVVGVSGAWALGLSLSGGDSWTLENISPGSPHESITWTVTNTDGTVAEDISISVADSANWQSASASDVNKFVLDHNAYSPGTPWKNITTGGVSLKDNLPATGTKNFKLQFTAPQSGSVGSEQSITVTLSAHNQWYSGPILSDIDTHYGRKNDTQQVLITGTGFEDPARVRLNKTGETSIVDESPIYTSDTSLTAEFNLTGANEGIYTIEVENVNTGDTSPAKTAPDATPDPDVDCFFGVAASDSDEWTTDAGDITSGKKAGSSSLTTLTGTMIAEDGYHCEPTWYEVSTGLCEDFCSSHGGAVSGMGYMADSYICGGYGEFFPGYQNATQTGYCYMYVTGTTLRACLCCH